MIVAAVDALRDLFWLLLGMSAFGSRWWAAGATGAWVLRFVLVSASERQR